MGVARRDSSARVRPRRPRARGRVHDVATHGDARDERVRVLRERGGRAAGGDGGERGGAGHAGGGRGAAGGAGAARDERGVRRRVRRAGRKV